MAGLRYFPSLRIIVQVARERRARLAGLPEGKRVDVYRRPGHISRRQLSANLNHMAPGTRPRRSQRPGKDARSARAPNLVRRQARRAGRRRDGLDRLGRVQAEGRVDRAGRGAIVLRPLPHHV